MCTEDIAHTIYPTTYTVSTRVVCLSALNKRNDGGRFLTGSLMKLPLIYIGIIGIYDATQHSVCGTHDYYYEHFVCRIDRGMSHFHHVYHFTVVHHQRTHTRVTMTTTSTMTQIFASQNGNAIHSGIQNKSCTFPCSRIRSYATHIHTNVNFPMKRNCAQQSSSSYHSVFLHFHFIRNVAENVMKRTHFTLVCQTTHIHKTFLSNARRARERGLYVFEAERMREREMRTNKRDDMWGNG